jgi:hypothetical protein
VAVVAIIGGCEQPEKKVEPSAVVESVGTIGSLTEVFELRPIPVEGYSLVAGLQGRGSKECPPEIREYLKQYILTQVSERRTDVERLINSRNTAVVRIYGIMPAAVKEKQHFDVRVEALSGTQTTSLEGGWLYGADLKEVGSFGMSTRVLARVKGPVFTDTIGGAGTDRRKGYILGGGTVRDTYKIRLALREPDFLLSRRISNVLNTRFESWTAKAVSAGVVGLNVPAAYEDQKERFISIVKMMYLSETAESTERRIDRLVGELAVSANKDAIEAAFEGIGNRCIRKLGGLLDSPDEEVRLRAARVMLNLGSERGFEAMREIAMNKSSRHRVGALEAITAGANRNNASAVSRRLLLDEDFTIRLAAYEQLRKLEDVSITQNLVAGTFYLERISRARYKEVYVSRRGEPRIVLFDSPIYCRENIFVQSSDGEITIDAPAGQKYVSVIRKLAHKPGVPPIPLRSSFELHDIIRTLCEEPTVEGGSRRRPGLNVPYAKAISILKQMCEQGAVAANFRAGPLPEID